MWTDDKGKVELFNHAEDHLQGNRENLLQQADKGPFPFREKRTSLCHIYDPGFLGSQGADGVIEPQESNIGFHIIWRQAGGFNSN